MSEPSYEHTQKAVQGHRVSDARPSCPGQKSSPASIPGFVKICGDESQTEG